MSLHALANALLAAMQADLASLRRALDTLPDDDLRTLRYAVREVEVEARFALVNRCDHDLSWVPEHHALYDGLDVGDAGRCPFCQRAIGSQQVRDCGGKCQREADRRR